MSIRAEVVRTVLHPVKGLAGIDMTERGLQIHKDVGVVGDRNYVLTRNVPEQITWQKKQQFVVCVNTSVCAATDACENVSEHHLDKMPVQSPLRFLVQKQLIVQFLQRNIYSLSLWLG